MKTLEIDYINPKSIDYNRLNRPLFGDQLKQRIGDEILKVAREKGEWIPVDLTNLLGGDAPNDYLSAVDSMTKKGYVASYTIGKNTIVVEPTQKLARYYRHVDFLNKESRKQLTEK